MNAHPRFLRRRPKRGAGRKHRSWIDGPRVPYLGPAIIGKAIGKPPEPVGPNWIGQRIAPPLERHSTTRR